jgi:hypothetical protein
MMTAIRSVAPHRNLTITITTIMAANDTEQKTASHLHLEVIRK